jgi:hypothetical protein
VSFSAVAATWQNFYLLVGAAAATLVGLMFVAITFGASMIEVKDASSTRSFLDPVLTHFVQVLLTACLVVAPSTGPVLLGVLLVAMGALRLATLVRVHRHMREAQRVANDIELSDWISGIFLPLAAHLALAGCGVAFALGARPFGALAALTVVILLVGIYGAWELVLWLALTRSRRT